MPEPVTGVDGRGRPQLRPRLWWVLLLVAAIYLPTLRCGYALDGYWLASSSRDGVENPVVARLHSVDFYFRQHYWAGTSTFDGLYRPVTVLSFAATNHYFGSLLDTEYEALPQHLVNVLLHVLATSLAYMLARRIGAAHLPSLGVAALFGTAAIHSEAVAAVEGRAELLAFVFGSAAALLCTATRTWPRIAGGLLLFLALCSKESAVGWVVMVPILGTIGSGPTAGARWRTLLPALGAVAVAVALWLWLRHAMLADMAHIPRVVDNLKNPLAHVDPTTRCLSATVVLGYGLWKCVAPFPLCSLYGLGPFRLVDSPTDAAFLVAATVLLALLAGALVAGRRRPILWVAAVLWFGFALPSSNLIVVAGTIFGERLLYTPSLGLFVALAALPARALGARPIWLAGLVWTLLNAGLVVWRSGDWRDSETLVRCDVAAQPRSADLHEKVAMYLYRADPSAAIAHLDTALSIYPQFPSALVKRASHLKHTDRAAAIRAADAAVHSPFANLRDREVAQAILAPLLLGPKFRDLPPEALLQAASRPDALSAHWVALFERIAQLGKAPPATQLAALVAEARRRFPGDRLLALHCAIFGMTGNIRDAAIARATLQQLAPVWQLDVTRQHDPHFIKALMRAAECYSVLGERATALRIVDEPLQDPSVPEPLKQRIRGFRQQLARG